MAEKDDYFEYVANVLGVKSLYIDSSVTDSINSNLVPLLISVEGLASYQAEEKDLLEKMVAALKIDLNNIKIMDAGAEYLEENRYDFLIQFQNNPERGDRERILSTYSPRTLLKSPELKKQAWSDLQKAIQFFQN
jgi:hypothetical protein